MKNPGWLAALALAACGSRGSELSLTVSGVAASDLPSIQAELQRIEGVAEARAGQFKDGQVTYSIRYSGKGPDLAARLARSSSGLKNVRGFDDGSVAVSFDNASTPVAPTPAPAPAPAPAPSTADGNPPERPKDLPKDPLAYQIFTFPGGSIAKFDAWRYAPAQGGSNTVMFDAVPEGREKDFVLRVIAGTPTAQEMQQLFTAGPQIVQQFLAQIFPGIQRAGEPKSTTFGGDEAMVEEYTGKNAEGKDVRVRAVYIKKKDVGVAVFGIGTEPGHKEFGRAIDIVAQSVTFVETPVEPELTGTWTMNTYRSSGSGSTQFSYSSATGLTLYANGSFTESHASSAGGQSTASASLEDHQRGRVIKRGNVLTFRYDSGKVWTATYELRGGALMLNGNAWFRQ
jgi:hypothetical protein